MTIAMVAVSSKLVGSAVLAVASTDWLVFTAFAVQLFHLTPYAVFRSLATSGLDHEDQGSAYAILHCTQAVVAFLGPVSHTALFAATVRQMAGLVFIVSGSLLVIPLALLICVCWFDKRTRQQTSETESLLQTETIST
jgi:MFS-type transporter involved in bile tolerance (Atg22 family)